MSTIKSNGYEKEPFKRRKPILRATDRYQDSLYYNIYKYYRTKEVRKENHIKLKIPKELISDAVYKIDSILSSTTYQSVLSKKQYTVPNHIPIKYNFCKERTNISKSLLYNSLLYTIAYITKPSTYKSENQYLFSLYHITYSWLNKRYSYLNKHHYTEPTSTKRMIPLSYIIYLSYHIRLIHLPFIKYIIK